MEAFEAVEEKILHDAQAVTNGVHDHHEHGDEVESNGANTTITKDPDHVVVKEVHVTLVKEADNEVEIKQAVDNIVDLVEESF